MMLQVMNIRKKEKFIFADAGSPIRNPSAMDRIKEADLKAALEFQNNDFI